VPPDGQPYAERSTLNSQSSEAQTTRLEGDPYQDATELERINANGGGVAANVLQRGGSATGWTREM